MSQIVITSEEDAWALAERIIRKKDIEFPDEPLVKLDGWPRFGIYIEKPLVNGSITPTMMETFLSLQKMVYQTVAQAKYGNADIRHLSDRDRNEYELSVQVKSGSSDQSVDMTETITKLGQELIGKMSGKQIALVIVGMSLLAAGTFAFQVYLENKKETRIAELSSQERIASYQALQFADEQQTAQVKMLIDALVASSSVGSRIAVGATQIHETMLKSAANSPDTQMLGQEVKTNDAQELRAAPRRKAFERVIEQSMKVVDANTADPVMIGVVLEDPETEDQIRASVPEAELGTEAREALFAALGNRGSVWVRMKVRDIEGQVRSVVIESVRPDSPPLVD